MSRSGDKKDRSSFGGLQESGRPSVFCGGGSCKSTDRSALRQHLAQVADPRGVVLVRAVREVEARHAHACVSVGQSVLGLLEGEDHLAIDLEALQRESHLCRIEHGAEAT